MAKCPTCGAHPVELSPPKMDDTYYSTRVLEAKDVFNRACEDAREREVGLKIKVKADGRLWPVLQEVEVIREIKPA